MKANGKIIQRQRKGYTAYVFSIVKNFRCPMSGRPTNKVLVNFGTIKSTDLHDPKVRQKFWFEFEQQTLKLRLTSGVMQQDIATIRAKFAGVIPRPTKTETTSTPPTSAPAPSASNPSSLLDRYPILSERS